MRTPGSSILTVGGCQGTGTLTHWWEPWGQGDIPPVGPCHSRAPGSQQQDTDNETLIIQAGCSIFAESGTDTPQQEIKLNRPFCPEALNILPSVKRAGEAGVGLAAAKLSGRGFMF